MYIYICLFLLLEADRAARCVVEAVSPRRHRVGFPSPPAEKGSSFLGTAPSPTKRPKSRPRILVPRPASADRHHSRLARPPAATFSLAVTLEARIMSLHLRICQRRYIYICMYMYIYIYIHTYIHT